MTRRGVLARLSRHALALELAGAAFVSLWMTRSFWFPGRYVVAFDTVTYSGPNMEVTLDAWRDRRLPLWNDLVFGGVTHLGNPQAGALYPPKVVGLLLDTNRTMGVLVAVHVVLLAIGTVLLVRRIGCRPPAGFAAALVLTAGGAVLTRAVQFEQILVLAWAPLLLLGVTAIVDSPERRWGAMAGTAVFVAMTLLAGHPQIVYQLVVLAAAWTVALSLRQPGRADQPSELTQNAGVDGNRAWRRRPPWGRLADLGAAVVTGVLVAAPQLVAALAATRDSEIGIGRSLDELESPALATRPEHLVQVLLGSVRRVAQDELAGGFESIGYVGAAAGLLAVVGLVVAVRDQRSRSLGIAVSTLAVLGTVWALGPRTPAFTAAYDWLPGFDLARASARWLDVTALCVALGVAWAVDAVMRRADLRVPALVAAALLAIVVVLAVADAVLLPDRWTIVAWALAAGAAACALALARRRPAVAATVVVAIVAVELVGTFAVSPIDALTTSTPFDELPAGAAGELRGRSGLTVARTDDAFGDTAYLVAGFRPNTNVLAGVRSLDGYDGGVQVTTRFAALGAELARDADPGLPLRNKLPLAFEPELAAELGVRWAVLDVRRDAAEQLPGWTATGLRDDQFSVWENPAWVGDAVLEPADGSAPRGLEVAQPSPERIVVDVDGAPGRLVVHRQQAPGWSAEADGRDVDIDGDGLFLELDVPAGAREIVLTYRPRWVTPSLAASTLGALGVVSVSLVWGVRRDSLKRRR